MASLACVAGISAAGAPAVLAAECPNAALRQPLANHLPDCRAYEQVSPVDKSGFDIGNLGGSNAAAGGPATEDGNAIAFQSAGAFAGTPWGGTGALPYLARRDANGWSTSALAPRPLDTRGLTFVPVSVSAFTPDMRGSILSSAAGLTTDTPEAMNYYRRNNDTGLLSRLVAFTTTQQGDLEASSDLRHAALHTGTELTDDPGQPPADDPKVYEIVDNDIRLVAREPVTNAPMATESNLGNGSPQRSTQGAVSDDGRHIFFTSPRNAPDSVIYRRTDGETTAVASPSKRTPPDPVAQFKGFITATGDGNRVFFKSVEQLTDNANSPTEFQGDLYRYDFDDDELINLTAGTTGTDPAEVASILGISEGGDRVYYVATGQVVPSEGVDDQPNLYLWEDDGTPDGTTRYIATLDFADEATGWDLSNGLKTSQVSRDGEHLLLESVDNLDPGFDSGGFKEVYRYDAGANGGAGGLTCVSCVPGTLATGPAELAAKTVGAGSLGDYPRSMSEDGSRVVFSSPDQLLDPDTNGNYDAYLWEDGELSLLSTGRSSDHSYSFGMSADGGDAFFRTREPLVPADGDTLLDLYTAHIGGGFQSQQQVTRADCQGEACKGSPQGPPASTDAPSADHHGAGNVRPPAPSCNRFSKKAKRLSKRATGLRRAAKRADSDQAARQLRKRATRASGQAKKQRAKAKRCKRRNQGEGK